ncbi:mycothiol system anti-sigma-R factor [Skermania piniformis]|uniref:Mycothiol system anti-sigma-R factor n=1 Tax=Skermania pinensis TaxID=39122 RepID=A0ABX8SA09_9ACTN|nr:mycothiol system anti-sigma-R factor [Skermania piniformis]QXQ14693.1 mycothiol system anti-sigma-R factor [Skermania piniformis]
MSVDDGYELDCAGVIYDVWRVLDDECDQVSRQRLQQHLDHCVACLETYGVEQQIKAMLSRKCGGERAPEALRQRLTVQIRQTVIVRRIDPS